ncbi:hypothetical protein BST61_g1089 [Cercospora zeina]
MDSPREATTYWLPFMPKLEALSLLYPVAPVLEWRMDIRDTLGESYIPNLTFLQISNFQCETEGLERYLLLHKDTLRDFSLSDVHLRGSNWPACLTVFAGKLPGLRRARLLAPLTSFDAEADEEIVYYIGQYMQSSAQIQEHQNTVEDFILTGEGPAPSWTAEELIETDAEGEEGDGSHVDWSHWTEETESSASDETMTDYAHDGQLAGP